MNSKKSPHWLQSILIHLALLSMGCVFYFLPHTLETNAIHLENILDQGPMKKLLPQAHLSSEEKSFKKDETPSATTSSSLVEAQIQPSIMQAYLQEVTNRIHKLKRYPKDAQMNEQEGMVGVLLEVAPDGKILQAEVEKPSSFESLNQAALAAIQQLGSLPPLSLKKPIKLHIPIQFQLL